MGQLYVLLALSFASALLMISTSEAYQCGRDVEGALCRDGLCCSRFGWCGSTALFCDPAEGCQSQCWGGPTSSPPPPSPLSPLPPSLPSPPPPSTLPSPPPPPSGGGDVESNIPQSLFDEMLKRRNDPRCSAANFYTYDAFITAAKAFGGFGTAGDLDTRKREIAAFFGQTSQETFGGWDTAEDGPYAWGYCHKEERNPPWDYCVPNAQWPCAPGKWYFGRGPMQLSYNFNYGPAGRDLGLDLLNNPDLVAADPVAAFKAAIWFWMTPQPPKPSCHEVIIGGWTPSAADLAAGRVPGYGVITNIINGGLECGHGWDQRVENRIQFYKRYCNLLGLIPGDNLDCFSQQHFGLAAHHLMLPSDAI